LVDATGISKTGIPQFDNKKQKEADNQKPSGIVMLGHACIRCLCFSL
jgi:hypothetical protein